MRLFSCVLSTIIASLALSTPSLTFVKRIVDPEVYYAVESRNYPEAPDTLIVTCRGGGLKIFNTSSSNDLTTLSRWDSTLAVEGQDRRGNTLIVAELGVGPSGPFPGSQGPKLHVFDVSSPLPPDLEPIASVDLSGVIDAILHVKFVDAGSAAYPEVWAVCSGGFATTVDGAVVLVNITGLLQTPAAWSPEEATSRVNVLSVPEVAQPEGIVVSPLDSSFLYLGGINSTTMAVINVSEFWEPRVVELRTGAGAQLVSASWRDQPHDLSRVEESNSFDPALVFSAVWGVGGGLSVLNTKTSSSHPIEVARDTSRSLSYANRVKLAPWGTAAFLPLEQPLGAAAAVELLYDAGTGRFSGLGPAVVAARVPVEELKAPSGNASVAVDSAKAYCLAVSGARTLYLFVAETAAIYIYAIED